MILTLPFFLLGSALALSFGQSARPAAQTQAQSAVPGTVKTIERPAAARVSKPKRGFTVPGGRNYFLRAGANPGSRTSFDVRAPGQVLEELHCVQIDCPPGMAAGTVCWRCYEILAPGAE
jgi:hypothetical protein